MTAPSDAALAVMERARIRLDAAADHHAHEGNEAQAKRYVEITNEMIKARAAVAELVEAAREHLLQASRVQAEKPGTYEREQAEARLHGACYFNLRAALAKHDPD